MREMVLNHASVFAPGSNREWVTYLLVDLAGGIAELICDRVVQKSLRTAQWLQDTPCLSEYSLFDACLRLQAQGYREEYGLLMGLAAKVPLLSDVDEEVSNRFLACEERTLATPEGEPLVFCAITDGIAVGFPSAPEWDRDRVTVHFDELLPDESTEPTSEEVDQLTRALHAGPICERHRDRLRTGRNPTTLWENREAAFPNLAFGPGVQDDLKKVAHLIPTITRRLADLDASARDWLTYGGPAPAWRTKVTPESDSVMNRRALREARRFPSHHGTNELFEWHARFGGGRIHLRFNPESREVEIGYIGPHLPLP